MNTSKQNTANVVMRGIERHEKDHADLLTLCTDRLCVLLSEIASKSNRIRQLEAAVILGDAGMAIARAGIIKENEVLAPYLEMKSRAEAAEARLAVLETEASNQRILELSLRTELAAMTKELAKETERADLNLGHYADIKAELAKLREPVGDEEEREAWEWERYISTCSPDYGGKSGIALKSFARSLRAKSAALKEAEARIAALELDKAEGMAALDIKENRCGFTCPSCGAFYTPMGYGKAWHRKGCVALGKK